MKVQVYNDITNNYILIELSDDFAKNTMLADIPNENNEIIELPAHLITYSSLIACIEDNTFDGLLRKLKTCDFLNIKYDEICKKIGCHIDFNPEKLGGMTQIIIDVGCLNEKNLLMLENYLGYKIVTNKKTIDTMIFSTIHPYFVSINKLKKYIINDINLISGTGIPLSIICSAILRETNKNYSNAINVYNNNKQRFLDMLTHEIHGRHI